MSILMNTGNMGSQRINVRSRRSRVQGSEVQGSGLPYVLLVQRYVTLTMDFGASPFCMPKKNQQTPRSHESAVQSFGEPLNPEPMNP